MAMTGIGTKFKFYDTTITYPSYSFLDATKTYGLRLTAKTANEEGITFKAVGSDTATNITVDVTGKSIVITYVLAHGAYTTSTVDDVIIAIENSSPASALVTVDEVGTTTNSMFDVGLTPITKWVALANITNISGPTMSKETVDTTALDTTGGYKTFITGMKNPGTITLNVMFDKEIYYLLKDMFDSYTSYQFMIELPDKTVGQLYGTMLTFNGLITEVPLTIPPGDKITCDVTVQIDGQVVYTKAT
jgi:predicted secreted protein